MKRVWLFALVAGLLGAGCGQKQDPVGSDAGIDGPVGYAQQIKPILDANCIRCHAAGLQGTRRNGAPPGFDYDSYEPAQATAERANAQIQSGSMPAGSGPLSDGDKGLFQAWIDQGTPE